MKTLDITCKGIGNISSNNYGMEVTLEQVSVDFIEQISTNDIIMHKTATELLTAIDIDDIFLYLQERGFEVK